MSADERARRLYVAIEESAFDTSMRTAQAVCVAIVQELGITREMVQGIRVAADALAKLPGMKLDALSCRQRELVIAARRAADAHERLLDASGASDER